MMEEGGDWGEGFLVARTSLCRND